MKRHHSVNPSAAVLWASAFVIGALVILQAGRLPPSQAHAEMVLNRNNYTLLTTDLSPGGPQLLFVIDSSRDPVLMVYEIEDARRQMMTLRDGGNLDNVFRNARR